MEQTPFTLVPPSLGKTRVVYVRGRAVKAVISTHPCDERCTSARGHLCECSCGGVNHGRDYKVAPPRSAAVAAAALSLF
jgi:hypothetical protein